MNNNSRIGYMDYTDFCHELGEASGGNEIFPSLNETLEFNPCAKHCGVVKVKIELVEVVNPPSRKFYGNDKDNEEDLLKEQLDMVERAKLKQEWHRKKIENLQTFITRTEMNISNNNE
jgi:hypothetical protein